MDYNVFDWNNLENGKYVKLSNNSADLCICDLCILSRVHCVLTGNNILDSPPGPWRVDTGVTGERSSQRPTVSGNISTNIWWKWASTPRPTTTSRRLPPTSTWSSSPVSTMTHLEQRTDWTDLRLTSSIDSGPSTYTEESIWGTRWEGRRKRRIKQISVVPVLYQ